MTMLSIHTVVNEIALAALPPAERWYAARRLGGELLVGPGFVPAAVTAIIVLTLLFIAVSYSRVVKERKVGGRLFLAYAEKRGLSRHELWVLTDIATKSKLKRLESIFTMPTAFDRGAARSKEAIRKAEGIEAARRFSADLSLLREKLGFQKSGPVSGRSSTSKSKPGSRQIPVGKKIYVRPGEAFGLADVESTVIKNDDVEFAVVLSAPFEINTGEICRVQYYFGAAVWEFDTPVVSYHAGILVLDHTDNVRFINRRRFLRVPVNRPAFIARFPFARTLPVNNDNGEAELEDLEALQEAWGPPQFVPAAVTELAGPGLRVEAPIEVSVGERVVVILKVSDGETRESRSGRSDAADRPAAAQIARKFSPTRVVEDIGEVRHVEAVEGGFSIAVELTGLSDSNVDELVRATNAASLRAGNPASDSQSPGNDEYEQSEEALPVVAQGV